MRVHKNILSGNYHCLFTEAEMFACTISLALYLRWEAFDAPWRPVTRSWSDYRTTQTFATACSLRLHSSWCKILWNNCPYIISIITTMIIFMSRWKQLHWKKLSIFSRITRVSSFSTLGNEYDVYTILTYVTTSARENVMIYL